MSPNCNPYSKQPGFGFRFLRAKTALEKFGRDCLARPYCRSFDNCFEMNDGRAVVWALMNAAIKAEAAGDPSLAQGIRNMGRAVWPEWLSIYEESNSSQPCLDI
jgi:hypothetical protein